MDFDVVEIVVVVVAFVIGLLDSVEICLASSGREGGEGGGEDTVVASLSITFSLSHARCLAVFADSDQKAWPGRISLPHL